jgi:hypothetical protein
VVATLSAHAVTPALRGSAPQAFWMLAAVSPALAPAMCFGVYPQPLRAIADFFWQESGSASC